LQLTGFALALVSVWFVARPTATSTPTAVWARRSGRSDVRTFLVAGASRHHGIFWPLVAARVASTLLMLIIVAFSSHDSRRSA